MRRIVAARSLGLVLTLAGVTSAQEPPPLEAPAPAELPPVLQAQPIPGTGPVLAVPGSRPGMTRYPRTPAPVAPSVPGFEMPPLVGPAEGTNPGDGPGSSGLPPWAGTGTGYGRSAPPLTLETLPDGSLNPLPDATPSSPLNPGPGPGLGADGARRSPLVPPPPITPSPRRPRLFGRWQPPPLLRGRTDSSGDETISVEPRSDPAADAALKRRIEQQVDQAVGNKLRSLEVKVVDRDVTIHARVNRFWFRRGVKHTIESLPTLSGYRTHIEVVD